jgi:lipid II:glycine glycyltransferase (peptidoglycan interpeptide bridge formation enzyme)
LYTTHVENISAKNGHAKPWSHFKALRELLPAESVRLWTAQIDGITAAALLLLYYNRTVEYFVPVIKHEFRSFQPMSLLIFLAMLDAVKRGFSWWNWGGTWLSQESLLRFKAGFGAQSLPYRYFVIVPPDKLDVIQKLGGRLAVHFPYYYVYPFSRLSSP